MRKLRGAIALALCLMMCPIMVTHADFTPSVGYKPAPEIVTTPDADGRPIIGYVKNENGDILSVEYLGSIIITPIAEVDTSKDISKKAADELKKVYNNIVLGKTDFSKHSELNQWVSANLGKGKDGGDLVVRDIFDITEISDTLLKYLPGQGNTIDLTFDLDVPAGEKVAPMVYINGKWEMAPKVVNNGDGTITVTFEHFSPVAFLVEGTGIKGNLVPVTGDTVSKDVTLWIVLAVASLAAMIGLGVYYRRRTR